ncbi:hypothetical protein SO802_021727 [Lithocarpus litseifolius]|uniref:RNase H type-1 domain-containing protein n=1 Tax=Lithocarpus litseifolius TaxID=425828 RepID=A0AAW2CFX6_9ROSI
MKSRHLIEAGARWRVGDGQQVRIFIDKWLQDGEGVLSSPSAELHPEATVSMLINRTSGWWNVQLIDRCFHPPDATRIKALPLCSTPQSDMLFWPLEKSGKYSVKSGFRLLCDSRDSSEGMPPANTEEVWEVDFGWISGSGWAASSFTELVKLVFTRPDLVPLFAATAWSIWFHRNKVRLNENTRLMGQIAGFARDYVRDFRSSNSSSSTVRSTAPKVWSPPGCNEWKINFDGAMFCESDEAGVGVVVRNSSGVVVAALTEKIRKPPSVEVLELLAARRAALFSDELGLDRVIFEGDSEQVIKALQWGGWDLAAGGHLIRDIFCTVNSFVSTSFSHVCRQGNAVAHALAQRARLCSPISVWLDSYLGDISSFVNADLPALFL